MDLSAVIFVALALAWAVYLVPKALKHHDEVARTRSVERFSVSMRTLGRRDAVPTTAGRAVVTPGRPASASEVTVKPRAGTVIAPVEVTLAQRRARRAAAELAAKRRRRVLGILLLATVAAVLPATVGLSSWWIAAAPATLVVAWLVTCRVTVRSERARAAAPVESLPELAEDVPTSYDVLRTEEGFAEVSPAAETSTIDAAGADPSLWAPRPITLPTYLGKDMAPMRQYVLTKDDSGVWSAGHDTSDSLLAQEVRDHEDVDAEGRAVGS